MLSAVCCSPQFLPHDGSLPVAARCCSAGAPPASTGQGAADELGQAAAPPLPPATAEGGELSDRCVRATSSLQMACWRRRCCMGGVQRGWQGAAMCVAEAMLVGPNRLPGCVRCGQPAAPPQAGRLHAARQSTFLGAGLWHLLVPALTMQRAPPSSLFRPPLGMQ